MNLSVLRSVWELVLNICYVSQFWDVYHIL